MQKIRNVSYKDWQRFFRKNYFSRIPPQQILLKEKTYDLNDLLALSLMSVMVYINFLGKKFYCTYLKTTAWDSTVLCKTF